MSTQTAQPISTDNIESSESGVSFSGREAVNTYAFIMLRRAVLFRMKHGQSMLRNQEARMANNYGWSDVKRWNGQRILDDLNKIGDAAGIPRAK